MKTTYTAYKLTKPQLKILAQLKAYEDGNKKVSHHHGMAGDAIRRKGLIEPHAKNGIYNQYPYECCALTNEGRLALSQARAEGW